MYDGPAYVMERNDVTGSWNETAKLTASEGTPGSNFGSSVSISGNIAIVGALSYRNDNGDDSGSAYVFRRDDATGYWNETAKLTASDGDDNDYFGESISVSGNAVIVGAYGDDDKGQRSGSAYIFEQDDMTFLWNETAKLTASDGAAFDNFARSVSISGKIAIVGSPFDDDQGGASGSAYVFEKDNLTGYWTETAKLTASDGGGNAWFGYSVSVSGNIVVVGAQQSGSAYVFEKNDSTGHWNETAKLTASDGAASDFFGRSVSVSGNIAIVGAYLNDDDGASSGSVYMFEKNDSTGYWNETAKLTASDGAANDFYGFSVSLSGNTAFVGAYGDGDKGFRSGSAYTIERIKK